MFTQIIKPESNKTIIELPDSYVGKNVTVIAVVESSSTYPVNKPKASIVEDAPALYTVERTDEMVRQEAFEQHRKLMNSVKTPEQKRRMEELSKAFEGLTFNSKGYKFNRDEANDYD